MELQALLDQLVGRWDCSLDFLATLTFQRWLTKYHLGSRFNGTIVFENTQPLYGIQIGMKFGSNYEVYEPSSFSNADF